MGKPILFLLPPGFMGDNRREYCPECAEIWGLLAYYPALLPALDIHYQPIDKPRAEMIDMLGAAHQNCPTLVFSKDAQIPKPVPTLKAGDHRFIENARDIGLYFAHQYGTAFPRGHY